MADSKTSGSAPQDNEHNEPGDMAPSASSGLESPPMWAWGLIFVVLFAVTYFVGANLGNIGPDPWPKAAMADGNVVTVAETSALPDAEPIYSARCVVCHQPGGSGMPGLFPPLAGSEWVTGNADVVTRIVLDGIQGPIEVGGESYNSAMPGLAAQMSDEEVASIVSHVRTSFGNNASTVTAADVARVRAEGRTTPWTADELSGMLGESAPAAAASTPVVAATPAPSTPAPAPTPVAAVSSGGSDGAGLFTTYACNTCHAVDSPAAGAGPSLYDVGSRLSRGEIYQSIVDPDAVVADGYAPGAMSAMLSGMNFSTSELSKMVNYLANLKG